MYRHCSVYEGGDGLLVTPLSALAVTALVYCMDFLEKNVDWLLAGLSPFNGRPPPQRRCGM